MSTVTIPGKLTSMVPRSERIYQAALSGALACLGFFALFSSAGVGFALGVLLILCCLPPSRVFQFAAWREPVVAIGLVLLAYVALRTLAADGFAASTYDAINRYHELLLLPLLWALMRTAWRPNALVNGLMLGAVLFATAHWLAPFSDYLEWFLHNRRISGGFGLAVCAFLLFEHARLGRLPPRVGYGLAGYLALTIVFASDGRTGHVVLLILMACAAFRASPPRLRAAVVAATLAAGLLVAYCSSPIRSRMIDTWAELQAGDKGQPVAPQSRIELVRTGLGVVRGNWLVGTGWTQYRQAFSDVATQRHGTVRQDGGAGAVNPHNEYVLQLGAGGVPALILFVAWLAWPMWRAVRERTDDRPWAGAVGCVSLAFAVSALFNSVLLDFMEAHFYVAVMAWLLVRRVDRSNPHIGDRYGGRQARPQRDGALS
ncbi:MAG: putative rane protein [Ramlibacter sp.]|nr:putative rane protein [Ramlibacter sp.]